MGTSRPFTSKNWGLLDMSVVERRQNSVDARDVKECPSVSSCRGYSLKYEAATTATFLLCVSCGLPAWMTERRCIWDADLSSLTLNCTQEGTSGEGNGTL